MKKLITITITCLLSGITMLHADEGKCKKITISRINVGWFIDIYTNGMLIAQFGSGPFDQVGLPPGSIEFENIYSNLTSCATNIHAKGTSVIDLIKQDDSRERIYLSDESAIINILPHDPNQWSIVMVQPDIEITQGVKSIEKSKDKKIHVSPISERMKAILSSNPIYPKRQNQLLHFTN